MTYDMIILGGGPGGYTAALYAARAGMQVVVLEKLSAGGQMALTDRIDNYPGFPDGIDGFQLGQQMQQQAERFGAETVLAEVSGVNLKSTPKEVITTDGTFYGKTVIIATGADPRELGLPEEKALLGKGVNYCAACDGMRYRDKTVAVIGGGNTAVADALQLSRIAKNVILVHRRDTLRATNVYHAPLMRTPNIEFRWNSQVVALLSNGNLTGIRLRNTQTGEESILDCDGIFVSIGRAPNTGLFAKQLSLDEGGYIIAGESTETNLPGVFAVGDVRTKALRQIVTAISDGATATHYAAEYLASL